MRIKQQLIIPFLLCLSLTACLLTETKPQLGEFRIVGNDIEKAVYQVEVAGDSASRRRGLMYRKELPQNQGMLLDYKQPRKMAIWMKNTTISLDILFIDANGLIVKVHERAEPFSTRRISSDGKVRAVLELNAGQVEQQGIKVGDQVFHASFQVQ